MNSRFDFLTGIVHVDADAPADWVEEPVLPVWARLNDPAWGDRLPRLLIHETVHFWQLLGSGYLTRLVADEWQRLLALEADGTLLAESARVAAHRDPTAVPFAADELVEAWCRYWDVHIRGPLRVMAEEHLERPEGPTRPEAYSHTDYDFVMTHGPLEQLYARPYRWLLDRTGGDSLICNALFPFVVFTAFASDEPVTFVREAMGRLLTDDVIAFVRRAAAEQRYLINQVWLAIAETVLQQHLGPLLVELSGPSLMVGSELVCEPPLSVHPLLGPYAVKAAKSNFGLWAAYFYPAGAGDSPAYASELSRLAREGPVIAQLCMPGQPWYRLTLGALVPPPVIRFRNLTWSAPVELEVGIPHGYRAKDGETFAPAVEALERRARYFRYAQEEVALGLPIGTFPR
ncbi:hypothetical protein E1218_13210 [Kribbella turkmenica]|uniref:Uncharacterized protein n=1 Tax=Kribbella turkmenica TaxID=2530375 RepID=A0A4R4X7D4_9ACTN|nr:hypothetical protein [Kribbella turkmenica]TDD26333.1 hypothetical protein E1218_13210 [Kribbella turkmenica]